MDYAIQKLIEELKTGNDRQRRAASYRLGKFNNPEIVPSLIDALKDEDGSVRCNAIAGLNSNGSEEARSFLSSHPENISEPTTRETSRQLGYFVFAFIGWYILSVLIGVITVLTLSSFPEVIWSGGYGESIPIGIISAVQILAIVAVNRRYRGKSVRVFILSAMLLVVLLVIAGFFSHSLCMIPGVPFPLSMMSGC